MIFKMSFLEGVDYATHSLKIEPNCFIFTNPCIFILQGTHVDKTLVRSFARKSGDYSRERAILK